MTVAISNANRLKRGKSANLWQGKSLQILRDKISEYGYGDQDDFLPYQLSSGYDLAQIDTGTGTVTARELAGGGWIRLDPAGTTTAEGPQLQRATAPSTTASGASYAPSATRKIYFESLIRVTTLGGNGFFGLNTVEDNCLETDGTSSATGSHSSIGIYIVNSEIRLVAKNGTTFDVETSVGTVTTALALKVGFVVNGITSITPFINGIAITSKRLVDATSSIPSADLMVPTFAGTSITNRTLWDMDWWAIAVEDEADIVGT